MASTTIGVKIDDGLRADVRAAADAHGGDELRIGADERSVFDDRLMLAHAVEPHRLSQFDIVPKGFFTRRRHMSFRPIALIKYQP